MARGFPTCRERKRNHAGKVTKLKNAVIPIGSKRQIASVHVHGEVLDQHRAVGANGQPRGVEDAAVGVDPDQPVRQRHRMVHRLLAIAEEGVCLNG